MTTPNYYPPGETRALPDGTTMTVYRTVDPVAEVDEVVVPWWWRVAAWVRAVLRRRAMTNNTPMREP